MCDVLCALGPATADGVTLFAKNSDRPPAERQVVEHLAPRVEATTAATHITIPGLDHATLAVLGSRPAWMWGLEHGVNEAGVAAGNATIYTTLDPRKAPDGLTGMDLVRLALERATSAAGAAACIVDLIERHGQGGSGHEHEREPYWSSFLLADPITALVLETSGPHHAIRVVDRTAAISNRTTIPSFDLVHRHPRQPVEALVDPRLDASRRCLADEPVTRDALVAHLASHVGGDEGWTVCMHVDGVEATTASMVAELPAGHPPRAWFLTGSPCQGTYAAVAWPAHG